MNTNRTITSAWLVIGLAACGAEDVSRVVDVGEYSQARLQDSIALTVDSSSALRDRDVMLRCPGDRGDNVELSVNDGVLFVESSAGNIDSCTLAVHNESPVTVFLDHNGDAEFIFDEDGNGTLGDINGDHVYIRASGPGSLHVGSIYSDDVQLELSGGETTIDAIVGRRTQVDLNGNADIWVDRLDTEVLDVAANGNATFVGFGTSDDVNVTVRGSATADLSEVIALDANVDARGNAWVSVVALDSLTVDARGNAEVVHSGDPSALDISTNGGATVRAE